MTISWRCVSVLFVLQVILNLFLLENHKVTAKYCSAWWFGENCQYLCSCDNNVDCDDDGKCPGECKKSFFGPGCQYKDILAQRSVQGTEAYLIDYDHTTCNPSSTATSVEISLDKKTKFAFLRIYSKNAEKLLNFRTLLNGNISCNNEQKYPIDNFVDVQCENNVNITKVVFEGPIAPDVCSVYLAVGRYLSAVHNIRLRNASTEANILNNDSCSYTAGEKYLLWTLTFQRPVMAIEIMIFNSKFSPAYRGLMVAATTIENIRVMIYQDTEKEINSFYSISTSTYYVIKSVTIYLKTASLDVNVNLCETQIYGEIVCSQGQYGLMCDKKCYCSEDELCNPVTGVCAPGCNIGYYGAFCSTPCSTNCARNECLNPLGICSSCNSNCSGKYCDTECGPETPEEDGKKKCSEKCTDGCVQNANNCSCVEKQGGQKCNDCSNRKFGVNCTDQCPDRCMDSRCYLLPGLCESCISQKRNDTKCQSICSGKCINGKCGHNTGYCLICPSGFYGPNCDIKHSNSFLFYFLLFILPVVIIIIIILYCCIKKNKNKTKKTDKVQDEGK